MIFGVFSTLMIPWFYDLCINESMFTLTCLPHICMRFFMWWLNSALKNSCITISSFPFCIIMFFNVLLFERKSPRAVDHNLVFSWTLVEKIAIFVQLLDTQVTLEIKDAPKRCSILVGTLMTGILYRFVRDGCIDGRTVHNISGTLEHDLLLALQFFPWYSALLL